MNEDVVFIKGCEILSIKALSTVSSWLDDTALKEHNLCISYYLHFQQLYFQLSVANFIAE